MTWMKVDEGLMGCLATDEDWLWWMRSWYMMDARAEVDEVG